MQLQAMLGHGQSKYYPRHPLPLAGKITNKLGWCPTAWFAFTGGRIFLINVNCIKVIQHFILHTSIHNDALI